MEQNIQIPDLKQTKYNLHMSDMSNIGHLGGHIS